MAFELGEIPFGAEPAEAENEADFSRDAVRAGTALVAEVKATDVPAALMLVAPWDLRHTTIRTHPAGKRVCSKDTRKRRGRRYSPRGTKPATSAASISNLSTCCSVFYVRMVRWRCDC